MENHEVDARGLACPQPVVLAKQALQGIKAGKVVTIVDNDVAVQNLLKLAENLGHNVKVSDGGDCYKVEIIKEEGISAADTENKMLNLTVLLTTDSLGRGSEELGKVLCKGFVYALSQNELKPAYLILMNSGVKLAVEGSPVLTDLQELAGTGTKILACGTCLDYFGLKDSLQVGEVSNMYTIVETLSAADKLITL